MGFEGTGVFVVFEEEACSAWRVAVPERFRFSDTNPITGRRYEESRFRDLPDYAAAVVRERLNMEPGVWNLNVEDRSVAEWVDPDQEFTTGALRIPKQQTRTRQRPVDVSGPGHAQAFHARRSAHPDYTWEQYKRDVARDRARSVTVVEVSDLDAPEAWL
jgi:hypothetical protein